MRGDGEGAGGGDAAGGEGAGELGGGEGVVRICGGGDDVEAAGEGLGGAGFELAGLGDEGQGRRDGSLGGCEGGGKEGEEGETRHEVRVNDRAGMVVLSKRVRIVALWKKKGRKLAVHSH